MLVLVRFNADCGRMGWLDGLFVNTRERLEEITGYHIYFGEVLGKHSEISLDMNEDMFIVLSEDQGHIEWLVGINDGDWTISGYNPFDYINEDENIK